MVPRAGLEPARALSAQWILSPSCLPIPPSRQHAIYNSIVWPDMPPLRALYCDGGGTVRSSILPRPRRGAIFFATKMAADTRDTVFL